MNAKHVPQRKTLFTRRPDSSTQSVSVVAGFSGKTSPSRMQRMAALLDMPVNCRALCSSKAFDQTDYQ
jgi:hypothetical protein